MSQQQETLSNLLSSSDESLWEKIALEAAPGITFDELRMAYFHGIEVVDDRNLEEHRVQFHHFSYKFWKPCRIREQI